ncbi:hypothetical protein GJ496_005466 [Pomphorhynchus laevis]|nr:hypothetical protein GJ496_005466 [Pomphorhynchus laevis]
MGDDTKENVNLNSTDARDSERSQTKQVTPFRHAIHDLNSEFLFTPMDRYFSLVDLLHAIVQHFYHNLYVLADL